MLAPASAERISIPLLVLKGAAATTRVGGEVKRHEPRKPGASLECESRVSLNGTKYVRMRRRMDCAWVVANQPEEAVRKPVADRKTKHDRTSGDDDAMKLVESALELDDVFEDAHADERVELAVVERKLEQGGVHELGRFPDELEHLLNPPRLAVDVDPHQPVRSPRKLRQEYPGAVANLDQRREAALAEEIADEAQAGTVEAPGERLVVVIDGIVGVRLGREPRGR
jgi:hypothetical protein